MDKNTQKIAIVDTLNADKDKKYYVYALCEKTHDDKLIPFYIGKGEGARVWAHEEGEAKEIEYINDTVEADNREEAINELSEKYKKIHKLGPDKIEKIIVKWGMSEREAFMAESALINLLHMGGLSFSSGKDTLTNIANGHASAGEKENDCYTKARTIEQFYEECAQEPLDFDDIKKNMNVVLISINQGYPECRKLDKADQDNAICETVRGFWKLNINRHDPEYLFAMYQQKIVGVYRIKSLFKEEKLKRKIKNVKTLYSILDINREDYPKFDNLPLRKNDYEFAKQIYDACEKDSDGNVTKVIKYSDLSEDLKAVVRSVFGELKSGETYDNKFRNWSQRKYYVLENILESDVDAEYREYVGRRIIEHKIDDETGETYTTSPIPPRNYIRYSK